LEAQWLWVLDLQL